MSRKKIVAGNWKMNLDYSEALQLSNEISLFASIKEVACEIIICPPFPYLAAMHEKYPSRKFSLGAQNCADQEKGAFTGETSVNMLASVGVSHVIIGHSERRSIYHETNAMINQKIKLALIKGLIPLFCIGETLAERQNGQLESVISNQLKNGLQDIDAEIAKSIIVAYEPVWAIGTGVTASPEQAQEAHELVREYLSKMYDPATASQIRILYGGSCNAQNAAVLFSQPDIDGGLIGGASLKAEDFKAIIQAASNS
ncbi:MAG: triose-phosphate isomerase [Flavobacteriales bacterium]